MISLIDTLPASEPTTTIRHVILSADTEVLLLPNLIQEDEMEMIDPEDPQPLSGKENKNQKPDTMVEPLDPSPTKQKLSILFEYIVAFSCLLFGISMFLYSTEASKLDTNIYKLILCVAILLMMWELIVITDITIPITCTYTGKIAEFKDMFQVLVLIMATIYFGYLRAPMKDENSLSLLFCVIYGIMTILQIFYTIPYKMTQEKQENIYFYNIHQSRNCKKIDRRSIISRLPKISKSADIIEEKEI